MAYLQTGTNTWGDPDKLREIFKQAIAHEKVVAVAVGTRPDCVPENVLDLMAEVFQGIDVWVELGVQTVHDVTLARIGRNHFFTHSADAINRIRARGFFVCAHLILGLPGESHEQMIETVKAMNEFGVHGVKFHPLTISRGSVYGNQWPQCAAKPPGRGEYVDMIGDLLGHLSPEIVVQRLVGGGRPEVLLAPNWVIHQAEVLYEINQTMKKRGLYQGVFYNSP